MPNPLQKSLHGYLSKIKRETGKLQLSSSLNSSFSSSKKWVLAVGKHPKKLHRRRPTKTRFNNDYQLEISHPNTSSDIDRFLEVNLKSLCIRDGGEEGKEEEEDDCAHHHRTVTKKKEKKRDQSSDEDENDDDYLHRFERTWGQAVYDSPKLPDPPRRRESLPPPPGSSEGRSSMYTTSSEEEDEEEERPSLRSNSSSLVLPENCIAVLRYTADPQEDFRRSMVETIESKPGAIRESEVDWDLMEELLFCYLNLNDKKSHKFIFSAFVDLIISLRDSDKEKKITRKSIERSLSTRAARERLRKRSDAFRN